MKKILILISFIPWLLYFYSIIKLNYNLLYNNKLNRKYIKSNFIRLFPIYDLILYAVYIFFSGYYYNAANIFTVRIILFFSIFLYLFFNNISKREYKEIKNNPSNKLTIYIVLISISPIIYYLIINKYIRIYLIMIALSVLNIPVIQIGRRLFNEK